MKPKLTLKFDAEFGQQYCICIDLDESVVREIQCIEPLKHLFPGEISFDEACKILKVREFRKDLFMRECQRLGALLAERMEDAEGWHDESRIEPAKRQLQTNG